MDPETVWLRLQVRWQNLVGHNFRNRQSYGYTLDFVFFSLCE
jgi:hypothetical protein